MNCIEPLSLHSRGLFRHNSTECISLSIINGDSLRWNSLFSLFSPPLSILFTKKSKVPNTKHATGIGLFWIKPDGRVSLTLSAHRYYGDVDEVQGRAKHLLLLTYMCIMSSVCKHLS